jgi:hypothetical protein
VDGRYAWWPDGCRDRHGWNDGGMASCFSDAPERAAEGAVRACVEAGGDADYLNGIVPAA